MPPKTTSIATTLRQTRPGFRYVDLVRRGYGLVECTAEATSVEYHTVNALATHPASPGVVPRRRARFDWPAGTHDVVLSRS